MSIEVKTVPVEAHHSIGMVERYHVPLRRAYDIIQAEFPILNKHRVLQMAVKAVNDTAGPDGLAPTLLVFGTFPRMVDSDPPHPSIAQRARAIQKAMREVSKLHVVRSVNDALRLRNGPQTDDVRDAPIGSNVLVYREDGEWHGPYQLLSISGQTCTIRMSDSHTAQFRITSVKPHQQAEQPGSHSSDEQVSAQVEQPEDAQIEQSENAANVGNNPNIDQTEPGILSERDIAVVRNELSDDNNESSDTDDPPIRLSGRRRRPTARAAYLTAKEEASLQLAKKLRADGTIRSPFPPFEESQKKELDDLLTKGVFGIVAKNSIPPHQRIFGCRFVDDIKYKDGLPYEKSRLVVQAYKDGGKQSILTQSPTIQRASQRLIISLAAMLTRSLCVRDISQAYVQSKSSLVRPFYVKPPTGTDLGDNILRINRPLYGIPEAGNHWFKTYHEHHTKKLNLTTSTFDPCLLFSKEAIVGMQTDDTIFSATDEFIAFEEEQRLLAAFPAKDVEVLSKKKPLTFNGAIISQTGHILQLTQERQCKKIELVDVESKDLKTPYVRERARGAYVASMTQPEAAFALSRAAQTTSPDESDAVYLNKCLTWQKDNTKRGLRFFKTAPEGLKLYVFVDASFANNKDLSSQIGYVIVLANEKELDSTTVRLTGNIMLGIGI